MLAVANAAFSEGPQTKIGHPAHRHRLLVHVPVLSAHGTETGSKTCVTVRHNGLSEI